MFGEVEEGNDDAYPTEEQAIEGIKATLFGCATAVAKVGDDLTYLLDNPTFDKKNDSDIPSWTRVIWGGGTLGQTGGVARAFDTNVNLSQTLIGVAPGTYKFTMNAVGRGINNADCIYRAQNRKAQIDNKTFIYAVGDAKVKAQAPDITSATRAAAGTGDWTDTGNGFIPNNGSSTNQAFVENIYAPISVVVRVGEDGNLTVGFSHEGIVTNGHYACFDNATLTKVDDSEFVEPEPETETPTLETPYLKGNVITSLDELVEGKPYIFSTKRGSIVVENVLKATYSTSKASAWKLIKAEDGSYYFYNSDCDMWLGNTRANTSAKQYSNDIVLASNPDGDYKFLIKIKTQDNKMLMIGGYPNDLQFTDGWSQEDDGDRWMIQEAVSLDDIAPVVRTTEVGNFGTVVFDYDAKVTGATLYEVASFDANEGLQLAEVGTELQGGVPYIFLAEDASVSFKRTGTETVAHGDFDCTRSSVGYGLVGCYSEVSPANDWFGFIRSSYVLTGNQLRKISQGNVTIPANRCFFDAGKYNDHKPAGAAVKAVTIPVVGDEDAIQNVNAALNDGKVYDLNGREVKKMQKGQVYIMGGMKVTVK